MPKLLYIVHSLNVGGTEILVANLAKNFSVKYHVAILTLDSIGKIGEELKESGIPIFSINRIPGWKLSNFIQFFKVLAKFKPDLIHAHQYTPFFFAAVSKIFRQSKAKLIFTEHGRHYPDFVSKKRQLANRLLWTQVDAVSAVCDFTAKALRKNEKYYGKITVIYNGVEIPKVSPQINLREQLGLPVDAQLVLYLGTLRKVKNPILLVEAMPIVLKSNPNVYAILIGDGEQRAKLNDLITKFSLSDNVRMLGELRAINRYWTNFNFIVQPSLSEAHSLALLEAMSQGLPAIVTNVGGAPEVIGDNHNGFLVESENVEQLAERILLLSADLQLQKRLGEQAKQDFENKFSAQMMIDNYATLYGELLGSV